MIRNAFVRGLVGTLLLALSLGLFAVPGICAEPPEAPDPELAQRFEGKSWEDVLDEFFAKWNIREKSVAIGYYNTVTGEEHYFNGDMYIHAASLYKVPLNMYYAEKVYNGEMAMDDLIYGIPYETMQTSSVQYSSNELSELLEKHIGTYREYREAIAPYLCDDPGTLPDRYYAKGNGFTPEQFIYALKKLYAEPERFPNILELMKLATPNNYFALTEDRFVIAHKYGYYVDDDLSNLNDAAVIYTDEPILLVMMSNFMSGGSYAMAEFCTLMCDYSQYSHQKRVQEEFLAAQQTPEPTPAPTPTPRPVSMPVSMPAPISAPTAQPLQSRQTSAAQWNVPVIAVLVGVFLLATVLSLIFLKKAPRWLVPTAAALLFAAGLFFFGRTVPKAGAPAAETPVPSQTVAPTPAPTPTLTPTPAPTPTPEPTPEPVREVDLGGIILTSDAETADLRGADISAEELLEQLQYLPALKQADICDLGFSNEESLSIVDAYPEIDFTWTVHFGRWAVRSDICVFSTLQASTVNRYSTEDLMPLFTYCKDLVALDLGHNAVADISALAKLEKLQVLILADNVGLTDITPLGELENLWYLELFIVPGVQDFSPLEKLTKMVDLNLCYAPNLTDPVFMEHMPDLQRAWLLGSGIPYSRRTEVQEAYPDTKVLFYYPGGSSTCDDWRATDRNVAIRKAFVNWENVLSFESWDRVEYRPGVTLTETKPLYER